MGFLFVIVSFDFVRVETMSSGKTERWWFYRLSIRIENSASTYPGRESRLIKLYGDGGFRRGGVSTAERWLGEIHGD